MSHHPDPDGMEGDLTSFPILQLLQWLHQTSQSVVMRIDAEGSAGWLFFKNGHLFRAEWKRLRGRDAVFGLTKLHEGAFWLSKRVLRAGQADISTPTAKLLLECALDIDRDGHPRAA